MADFVVEENNLLVHMVALRKLLGPQAIATIPGRGYRITMPVEEVANAPRTPMTSCRRATCRGLPPCHRRFAAICPLRRSLLAEPRTSMPSLR